MKNEKVRIVRILEYVGTREWLETTLNKGAVPANGQYVVNNECYIKSATIGSFAEILEEAQNGK
jgi:hypothetical protein